MFKTILLTTAFLWPIVTFAQDAPKAPNASPDHVSIENVIAKVCTQPTNAKLAYMLGNEYSIALVYDTPLSEPETFIRNMIFESKKEENGVKEVFHIAAFIQQGHVLMQCVVMYGAYETKESAIMKKKWETSPPVIPQAHDEKSPAPAPLTVAPKAGTVPAPNFQDNSDE